MRHFIKRQFCESFTTDRQAKARARLERSRPRKLPVTRISSVMSEFGIAIVRLEAGLPKIQQDIEFLFVSH